MEKRIYTKWKMAVIFGVCLFVISVLPVKATENGKTVKVGYFSLNGFFEEDSLGNYTGYAADYMETIAEYTGWNIQYIKADSWEENFMNFTEGKVDIVIPCQITPERLNSYEFSSYPMGTEYGSILTLSDNNDLVFEDFEAFNHMRTGIVPTLVFYQDFTGYEAENHFQTELHYYKDTPSLINALENHEVDAIVGNLMIKNDNMKLLSLFGADSYYIMLHRQDTQLLQELNEAINNIMNSNPGFQISLENKYFKSLSQIPISKQEQDFINDLDMITVGYIDDYAPVSYTDDKGNPAGITIDILDDVSARSGIHFHYVPLSKKDISYEYLQAQGINLLSNMEYNSLNKDLHGVLLTYPYLSAKKVFVMKSKEEFDENKEYVLALTEGAENEAKIIQTQYPNMKIVQYETLDECLHAIKYKKADLLIQNQYVVEPLLSKPQYQDLSVGPLLGMDDKLCLSIIQNQSENESSDEQLLSILNKTIKQIDEDKVSTLVIKEIAMNQYQFTLEDFVYQYRVWIIVFLLIFILIFVLIFLNRRIRKRNAALIIENEQKLRHITSNIDGGVVLLDVDKNYSITYANDGFLSLLAYDRDEFEKQEEKNYFSYIISEDAGKLEQMISECCKQPQGSRISAEIRVIKKDKSTLPVLFSGTYVIDKSGTAILYCVILDNSVQAKLFEDLQLSQERYERLMEQTGDIIFDIDVRERRIATSHQFEDKFGWSFPGNLDVLDRLEVSKFMRLNEQDIIKLVNASKKVLSKGVSVTCEVRILKKDNTPVWCEVFQFPMLNQDGKVSVIVGRIVDIDEEIRERTRLLDASRKDTLTGLYSKTAFHEIADQYLKNNKAKESAIIFMDLDHFKNVNDTLGHITGDQAILDAARKLQTIFSNTDILSRFGGDEFCVLVKDISGEALINKLEWMLEKMTDTYCDQDGNTVSVTCSIGIAATKECGDDINHLLDYADKALYMAKKAGRARYVFYHLPIEEE